MAPPTSESSASATLPPESARGDDGNAGAGAPRPVCAASDLQLDPVEPGLKIDQHRGDLVLVAAGAEETGEFVQDLFAVCSQCGQPLFLRRLSRRLRSNPRYNPETGAAPAGTGCEMKKIKKSIAILAAMAAAFAFQRPQEPAHEPVQLRSPVKDKNFYLLSAIEGVPAVRDAVRTDPALARIARDRLASLDRAVNSCKLDAECNSAPFRWSAAEAAEAGRALAALGERSEPVRAFAGGPLRASGMYVRGEDLAAPALLERAWSECIAGINHVIDAYALGKPPRYPAIDSITYDAGSEGYRTVLEHLTAVLEDDRESLDLAFSGSLRFALGVLLLNHRDEAGRFEPMEAGENAAAFRRVPSVEWNRYPYTVIVVPGSGNDRPGVRLSPGGMLRDEIAAKRFRDGKAPFLLVSGGFVHPSQTEYCEAIEMKRDLMTRFGIPENAILVDPHARHTTTNLRNAARLIYRYGIRFDRKALVTTDPAQSEYIEGASFAKRCMDELGYLPYRIGARTSPFDLEFVPTRESLQADPRDPLDP
jgi:hypothetical protein